MCASCLKDCVVVSIVIGMVGVKGTYSADTVVFLVISWLLDRIATDDGGVAVIVVAGVGSKIHFAEELGLMVLEFADHICCDVFVLLFPLNLSSLSSCL